MRNILNTKPKEAHKTLDPILMLVDVSYIKLTFTLKERSQYIPDLSHSRNPSSFHGVHHLPSGTVNVLLKLPKYLLLLAKQIY